MNDRPNQIQPAAKKRRYVKPVVESEQVFETLALLCAKCKSGNPWNQSYCSRNTPKMNS